MRSQTTDPYECPPVGPVAVRNGVVALSGYGLSVRVERGELELRDGIGRNRRAGRLRRATAGLARLVVVGHTGSITFEAIRWLHDVGAGYLQIDADGVVLASFGPLGADKPGLRRAQARALDGPAGHAVATHLITRKLEGQLRTLQLLGSDPEITGEAARTIDVCLATLPDARDRGDIRQLEAQGASAYWGAWRSVPVRFARRDLARIPAHWSTFGSRTSPLTSSPRLAANPANAMLNYLYALLEGEASIAARVVGLDPGLGVLHADQLNRDSLSADLMEPVRPHVDRYLARLLQTRTFAATDFFETRQGVCRVTSTLARELAQTSTHWGRLVGVVAEDLAAMLAGSGTTATPTPISGRNRSAGRGPHSRSRGPAVPRPSPRCVVCGTLVTSDRETCGPGCEAAARAEAVASFAATGTRALASYRAAGGQPVLNEEARERIGDRAAELTGAAREWQRTNSWPDPEAFAREILPALAEVTAGQIAQATGLSVSYCRQVKKGRATPHPMWWEKLRALDARA